MLKPVAGWVDVLPPIEGLAAATPSRHSQLDRIAGWTKRNCRAVWLFGGIRQRFSQDM